MFLEQFEKLDSKVEAKPKVAKKEYSAGFRNYHPNKPQPNYDSEPSTVTEEDILFQNLNIGNLKELYMQTLSKVDKSKVVKEQQKLSIDRLTKIPQKQVTIQNNEQKQKLKKENDELFNQRYHKIEGYVQKAQKLLFSNEFKKIKQKLEQITKTIKQNVEFSDLMLSFIFQRANHYQSKQKISNEQLLLDFRNFTNSERKSQNVQNNSIEASKLKQLLKKNIFFFGFYDIQQIKGQKIFFNDLKDLLRKSKEIQIANSEIREIINKKITVPYESQSIYLPRSDKIQIISQQKTQQFQKFKAKPVPKTNYERPKERPKSQMSKTQPQPFNLTQKNTNINKMQDYYKWQRQFHAKNVPKTTYKPNLIATSSEDQNKKRALQLLHSSKYPQNMKYLYNFNQFVENKQKQLLSKYEKTKMKEQQKSVPNFGEIHKRQIEEMQNLKLQNRLLTKPQPFNLSKPRPPKPETISYKDKTIQKQYNKSIDQFKDSKEKVKIKPKSTLKYDSYINHLKKVKEEKIQQEQQKKKQQLKNEKKEYKQLLKGRLHDQIISAPKKDYPQKLQQNIVKVNLQKIYQYEPLLIERQNNKKQAQNEKKTWEPII